MSKRITILLVVVGLSAVTGTLAACGNDSSSSAQTPPVTRPSFGGGPAGGMSAMFDAPLSDLVDKGTITDEQKQAVLDKLSSAVPQAPQGGAGGQSPSTSGDPQAGPPAMGDMFSTALDGLVSDGTITSAQEQAIIDALQAAMPQGGPQGGAAPGGP